MDGTNKSVVSRAQGRRARLWVAWGIPELSRMLRGSKSLVTRAQGRLTRLRIARAVSRKLSGMIWKELLSEAIDEFKPDQTMIIVDGGPENNNVPVDELLSKNSDQIQRLIAQKDITFSNSMVEAIIKIIKNNYLRMMNITSEIQLHKALEFSVMDYNQVRPHVTLTGSTPLESFTDNPWDRTTLRVLMSDARQERVAENRRNTCKGCISK